MDIIKVLLLEGEKESHDKFAQYADRFDDFFFVNMTNNSDAALQGVLEFIPDVIILDLELHQGSGSGLEFLVGLNNINLSVFPYILITTNNSSKITHDYARQLGADFIISKNQENYSEQYAVDFLRMMKSAIKNKSKAYSLKNPPSESTHLRCKHTTRIINELNLVGINPKSLGYNYLIDAICMLLDKPKQNICADIGEKYGKTEASVERAMQNAINSAWKKTDIDELLKHYTAKIHSERGAPTIMEFICYYSIKIKNE